MDTAGTWELLLMGVMILSTGATELQTGEEDAAYVSGDDVLLLRDEDDPKCFTRTEEDFTCFFETPENNTYDFYYNIDHEERCPLEVRRTTAGSFLHVCVFPPRDVFLFTNTELRVVDTRTNHSLCTRTVNVEDHVLLPPPTDVSLHHTGQPGQLEVTWQVERSWRSRVRYGIRYSSKSLGLQLAQGKGQQQHILEALSPGEEAQVWVRLKHSNRENTGHWGHWSYPASAMVPQGADDISLMCYTSDLENISCQWDEAAGGERACQPFYRSTRKAEHWEQCQPADNSSDLCCFRGNQSEAIQVRLSCGSGPLSRTFYGEPFKLHTCIRPPSPRHVKTRLEEGRLCLQWDPPLPPLSAHLLYQVRYQLRRGGTWMTVPPKGPETEMCLEVPAGSTYSAQVRAAPHGSLFSGHWSHWSHSITGDTWPDVGTLLLLCIPLMMLIIVVVLMLVFSRYLSMLKQYLWPPVPDLDKVLQGFLSEISHQSWDPPFTAKQCYEDTLSSVVEVMSEELEAPDFGKQCGETPCLVSQDRSSGSGEEGVLSPMGRLEVIPDYVVLNTDSSISGPAGSRDMCEMAVIKCGDLGSQGEGAQTREELTCTGRSSKVPPGSGTGVLNQSYLLCSEAQGRGNSSAAAGSLYANLQYTPAGVLHRPQVLAGNSPWGSF